MLSACPSKSAQNMVPWIKPSSLCQLSYRSCHCFIGDLDEPIRYLIYTHLYLVLLPQLFKRCMCSIYIQPFFLALAEYLWKELWQDPPQLKIRICNGQIPILLIADRPWISPCTFRANHKEPIFVEQSRPAARSNCVYVQLRSLYTHPSYGSIKYKVKMATESGDIGGGATHVEAD